MIVGIDPGKKSPAHVGVPFGAVLGTPGGWSDRPLSGGVMAAIVEGQFANNKASRQSLMTLSFYAGLQAGAYLGRWIDVYVVQPRDWKTWLQKGGASMPKHVFQNRLYDEIPSDIWAQGEDVVDAYCIAIAGGQMLEKGSKKLRRLDWKA